MRTLISQVIFIVAFMVTGTAQNYQITDYYKELHLEFGQADEKKFEKAIELLNGADLKFSEANEMYNALDISEQRLGLSKEYKKAFRKLVEASEDYKEGHTIIFMVFKGKAQEFWEEMQKSDHYAAGMEKAKYYERQAKKHFNRALLKRDIVTDADRFEAGLYQMKEAFNLEKLSIRDEGRAVQIYQDFPVEYNYGWEDDVSLEEVLALKRNPALREPPLDVFATVDKKTEVDSSLLKEIIFKVQIAAHTVPLTEEYLRTIYKGGMKIDLIYEEEWYKYSVGRYRSLEEATVTLENCNVNKAFIVAYQSGKKLTIEEALKRLALQESLNKESDGK
jgi:hypothetical protein